MNSGLIRNTGQRKEKKKGKREKGKGKREKKKQRSEAVILAISSARKQLRWSVYTCRHRTTSLGGKVDAQGGLRHQTRSGCSVSAGYWSEKSGERAGTDICIECSGMIDSPLGTPKKHFGEMHTVHVPSSLVDGRRD